MTAVRIKIIIIIVSVILHLGTAINIWLTVKGYPYIKVVSETPLTFISSSYWLLWIALFINVEEPDIELEDHLIQ